MDFVQAQDKIVYEIRTYENLLRGRLRKYTNIEIYFTYFIIIVL